MKSRKGFISTLEAIISSVLFFIFLINVLPALSQPSLDPDESYSIVNSVLETMDDSGELIDLVEQRDAETVEQRIEQYVQASVGVEIVYSADGEHVYRSETEIPDEYVLNIGYILTTDSNGEEEFSEVSVYLW